MPKLCVEGGAKVFSLAFAPKRPGALQRPSGSSSSSSSMCRPSPDSAEIKPSRTRCLVKDSDLVKKAWWDNTRWVKMLAGGFYVQTKSFSCFCRRQIIIVWAFSFFRHSWHVWAIRETPVCYVRKWAKCFIKLKSKNALEESASSILFYWLCQGDLFYPTRLPD